MAILRLNQRKQNNFPKSNLSTFLLHFLNACHNWRRKEEIHQWLRNWGGVSLNAPHLFALKCMIPKCLCRGLHEWRSCTLHGLLSETQSSRQGLSPRMRRSNCLNLWTSCRILYKQRGLASISWKSLSFLLLFLSTHYTELFKFYITLRSHKLALSMADMATLLP